MSKLKARRLVKSNLSVAIGKTRSEGFHLKPLLVNPALKVGKPEVIKSESATEKDQFEAQAKLILLSWKIAKAEGIHEAAAIRRIARKLRDKTPLERTRVFCRNLLKCNDNQKLVRAVEAMQKSLDDNGVIFTGES